MKLKLLALGIAFYSVSAIAESILEKLKNADEITPDSVLAINGFSGHGICMTVSLKDTGALADSILPPIRLSNEKKF